jgi:hypothetical protein
MVIIMAASASACPGGGILAPLLAVCCAGRGMAHRLGERAALLLPPLLSPPQHRCDLLQR